MPLPVISIAQMRDWEKATWAAGQTEAEVIRLVGKQVGRRAASLTSPGALVLILAGRGHNGDDARHARQELPERRVDVLEVANPEADLSKVDALLSLHPDLIIDGLFGIGLNRPLDPHWVRLINRVNEARTRVLAVDVPSGLNAETGEPEGAAIEACVTLTVGAPKQGLLKCGAWPFVGRLEAAHEVGLAAIPLASELQWTLAEDFDGFPPARSVASHKGTYGHVALIAGSLGFHGAAILTARGAQRAQPGLVTLYTLDEVYAPVASQLQAVMVSPWRSGKDLSNSVTAVGIGPGLAAVSVPDELKKFLGDLWRKSPLPLVVDASALSWLPSGPVPDEAIRVITPHPGEAARLLGTTSKDVQADRLQSLRTLSQQLGNAWVVLKGHQTLVGRSTGNVFVNSSGNPYLAQGGSGDLLSGYIAGLLAQPPLQSELSTTLRYAVWQHGAAADHLQETRTGWVVEDLVEQLGGRQG